MPTDTPLFACSSHKVCEPQGKDEQRSEDEEIDRKNEDNLCGTFTRTVEHLLEIEMFQKHS